MNHREKLNHVELSVKDLEGAKLFFSKVFGWTFTDHGPECTAFSCQGLDSGF